MSRNVLANYCQIKRLSKPTFALGVTWNKAEWKRTKQIMLGYLIVTISVTILGIIGNLLVLGTILMDRKLRVLNNIFLANLAVADLFIAGIIHPFTAVGIIRGKDGMFYHTDPEEVTGLCEFLASFCIISCSASVLSIGAVAMNRYIYICHHHSYPKIYTRCTVPVMVASIWIVGVLVDLPTYLGFGNHIFHERISTCFFDTTHPQYKIFFVVVGIFTPVAATVYCYVRIVYLVYKSNQRLRNRIRNAPTSNYDTAIKAADVRLLKTVAAMGVLAVIIYTPFSITLLLDRGQISRGVWMFANGLMHSFSCLNWFIYALTNKRIRDGIKVVWKRFTCRRCIDESEEIEMTPTGTSGKVVSRTLGTSSGGLSIDIKE